ncbi:MAG: sensor histidine kinase [Verrucomicrobiales bacterium]
MNNILDDRVLLLAPTGQDAQLSQRFLSASNIHSVICESMIDLCKQAIDGCGSILIAEETLNTDSIQQLFGLIQQQPPWSDYPITVITSSRETNQRRLRQLSIFAETGNATLLERPCRPSTLISVVEAGLRTRRKQYQVRDLLGERELVRRSIRDAFVTLDRNWRYTYVNDRAAELAEMKPAEMLGKNFWDLLPKSAENSAWQTAHKAVKESKIEQFEYFNSATAQWLGVRVYPSPIGVSILSADITETKMASESIRQAGERFRFMAEAMPHHVFSAGPKGEVYFYNKHWLQFTRQIEAEALKRGWFDFLHDEDRLKTIESWQRSMETGESFEQEHRFLRWDGISRWHITRAAALKGEDGELVMWIFSSNDIHYRKEQEEILEQTVKERTTELREKMAELEAYSYSISHDMRAPLRVLRGYSDILLSEYGNSLDETAKAYLQRINSGADRLDRLIQDVLTYSKASTALAPLEPVDLDHLIKEIVDQYPMFQPPVAMVTIIDPFPAVLGNKALITQTVANLLGNAVKFVPHGNTPAVKIWAEYRDGYVRLWVEDKGIGISAEDQQRIFDIFSRVHSEQDYDGTGIGLSIVKKAMQRMKGRCGVESNLGEGSKFWIELLRLA